MREPIVLEPLFESDKKEKILFFLYSHGEGYAREIARVFGFNLNTVQNQLQKLERHGILSSRLKGKLRIYSFNPRYPLREELEALLKKAMMYLPEKEIKKYYWPHLQTRRSERETQERSLQRGISYSLFNPWQESQLNRFLSSKKIPGKKSVSPGVSSKK